MNPLANRIFALSGTLELDRNTGGITTPAECLQLARDLEAVAALIQPLEEAEDARDAAMFRPMPSAALQMRWMARMLRHELPQIVSPKQVVTLCDWLNGMGDLVAALERRAIAASRVQAPMAARQMLARS